MLGPVPHAPGVLGPSHPHTVSPPRYAPYVSTPRYAPLRPAPTTTGGCFTFQCGKTTPVNDGPAAFEACKQEVETSTGEGSPVKKACTDSSCTFTAAMTAMSSATCGAAPGGGGGDPPAGGGGGGGGDNPTGGAVTEKPTTPTLCKAENQGECECNTGTGLATYVEEDCV